MYEDARGSDEPGTCRPGQYRLFCELFTLLWFSFVLGTPRPAAYNTLPIKKPPILRTYLAQQMDDTSSHNQYGSASYVLGDQCRLPSSLPRPYHMFIRHGPRRRLSGTARAKSSRTYNASVSSGGFRPVAGASSSEPRDDPQPLESRRPRFEAVRRSRRLVRCRRLRRRCVGWSTPGSCAEAPAPASPLFAGGGWELSRPGSGACDDTGSSARFCVSPARYFDLRFDTDRTNF